MRNICVWALALVLVFALAAGGAGYAQSAVDGAIGGRVVDARGAGVSGARVLVESAEDAAAHATAKSAADGSFLLSHLVPGIYRVVITAAGYSAQDRQMQVTLGAVADAQIVLLASPAVPVTSKKDPNDSVDSLEGMLVAVDAAPVLVTVIPSEEVVMPTDLGTVLNAVTSGEQAELLPVEGRRWQQIALLLPGGAAAGDGGAMSFRGLAATQNVSEIDGASGDQHFGGVPFGAGAGAGRESEDGGDSGGATGAGGDGARAMYGRHAGAAYTFAQGAVQEFRIAKGTYSALDGKAAGGVVTTISKSGTATTRGSLFYVARDSAWAAASPFSVVTRYVDGVVTNGIVKPRDFRQQFGGTVGGPLRLPAKGPSAQPRVFYFAAVDIQRRGNPAVSSPGYAGFYALTATQTALLGNRGVSAKATMKALNYIDSLTGSGVATVLRREDQQIAFGKLDWQVTAKNRISVQENHVRWDSPGGARSEPVVARGLASLGNEYGKVDAGVARWVSSWTTHLSNELRIAYNRDFEWETAQQPLPQEPAIGPGGFAPEVSIAPDGFIFGTPASLGRKAYPDERRGQAAEMVEWVHGRNLVQVGADFSLVEDRIDALSNQEGTFRYDSGATGGKAGGLVDWITDFTFSAQAYPNGACPSINAKDHLFCFRTFTQSFGQQAVHFATRQWAGFVQDEWRAAARLHVSAGVRYEVEREPLPQNPNPALDALFGTRGATSVFPADRNNVGPRVGLSWQPLGAGHGTVRIGYGIYFGRLPGATVRAALVDTALPAGSAAGSGAATHVRITPATVTGCPQVANQGFGYGCAYVSAPPAAVSATTTATVFDRRFQLPMVQQGSFGIEREVGHGIVISGSYAINLDRQLPNSVDINIAPETATRTFQLQGGPVGGSGPLGVANGETFVLPFYTSRVSTLFGPVTDIVSNANATYNALVLEASRRSRKGLEFRLGWTWSKAIDYGQNSGAVPRTNNQLDPFTLGYDKGLSEQNYPHRTTASAVWEPTLVTPRRWVKRAANGWQVSPILLETSGRPYSYEIFGGTRLTGGHTSINAAGGAVYLPTIGRDTLRLPDTVHLNLRINRSVRLTERLRLRASAEVFNLPNHVNYTSTTTRAYQPGTAVDGVTPLVFQDAATVAAEGLNEQPFGTYTSASTSNSRERQVQFGMRLEF